MLIDFNQLLMYNDFCTTYTDEQKIDLVRQYRNALLVQSDFSQLEDSPVDKEAWAEYRQQLRDYMSTYDVSNLDPAFPQKP
jgi:predicted metal-binding protein